MQQKGRAKNFLDWTAFEHGLDSKEGMEYEQTSMEKTTAGDGSADTEDRDCKLTIRNATMSFRQERMDYRAWTNFKVGSRMDLRLPTTPMRMIQRQGYLEEGL